MTAQQTTLLHGVFMNIFGIGTLLMGESGIGKSEIALALIARGHQLIADDAPEFFTLPNQQLIGHAPAKLQNLLEIRGLGLFNICHLFGPAAILKEQTLKLIIYLQKIVTLPRIPGDPIFEERRVLGISIPQLMLPIANERRHEVLVETLVLHHKLKLATSPLSKTHTECHTHDC